PRRGTDQAGGCGAAGGRIGRASLLCGFDDPAGGYPAGNLNAYGRRLVVLRESLVPDRFARALTHRPHSLKKHRLALREIAAFFALRVWAKPPLPEVTMSERDLFIAALKIPDLVARSAWLDQECSGDATLRRRMDVLLQAFDNPDSL